MSRFGRSHTLLSVTLPNHWPFLLVFYCAYDINGHDSRSITLSEEISPHIDDSDEDILSALQELPFSSVRQLSRATRVPKAMAYRRLSRKLGFIARDLRCVPQIQSDHRKTTRVQCSTVLLTKLLGYNARDWHDIVTLDKSEFYYIAYHELILIQCG
jgi:hypothetical protein